MRRFGGTRGTEDAVEAGLNWLAAHQNPDGSWSRTRFPLLCPTGDRCPGIATVRTAIPLEPGLTGLCLLAFLGAGYTDADGPHQQVVGRAVDALLRVQQADGGFSPDPRNAGYNDSLATFALAEYYALTRAAPVADALRRAVRRLATTQQTHGGWDYLPRPDTGRNDTSITAWMVQALQACAAAGLETPRETLVRAAVHLARATEPDGQVWYADADVGFKMSDDLQPQYRYGPAMTAAGLMCTNLLGMRTESPVGALQRALLMQDLPSARRLQSDSTGLHSYYYWYYGTVAMFQAGGDGWERWNGSLRDAILPLQDRSAKHVRGSWPPFAAQWGTWGRRGGRVYTTALCVLTLETYYRHAPAYLEAYQPLTAGDWRAALPEMNPLTRRWAIEALRELRLEIGEPVLLDLLADERNEVALEAAEALLSLDSPMGIDVLAAAAGSGIAGIQARYQPALERARAIAALPPVAGEVRVFDAAHRLATVELPRAYAGMKLAVLREGESIAEMRVARRHSGTSVVVAELINERSAMPQTGDRVVSLE